MRLLFIFSWFLFVISCQTTSQQTVELNKIPPVADSLEKVVVKKHWPAQVTTDTLYQLITKNRGLPDAGFTALSGFYSLNEYAPLWTNEERVVQGIRLLQTAQNHGLNPALYHLSKCITAYEAVKKDTASHHQYIQLELLLSKAVLSYAHHLSRGSLKPSDFHPGWNFKQSSKNIDSLVLHLIKENRVGDIEPLFEPKSKYYQALKKELAKYYQLKASGHGIYPLKYPGRVMQLGDTGNQVVLLRKRLCVEVANKQVNVVFDTTLRTAVKTFQRMHGLKPDGVAGPNTYLYLSWDTERYIQAIKINMERCRWLPKANNDVFLRVNLPGYNAKLLHGDSLLFNEKVIIGKQKHATPVFQSQIDRVVFNPCWTIPRSIVVKSVIPGLKRDSAYLEKRNMFLAINGKEQNTKDIDFTKYNASNFPFMVFQNSGPGNALGKVKFLFPNPYHIYMHDTPQKSLFNYTARAFSHGCIRLQNPLQLSQFILTQENRGLSNQPFMAKGYPEMVYLKKTIPVQIVYFTTDINNNGDGIVFLPDIYGHDYKVIHKLEEYDLSLRKNREH